MLAKRLVGVVPFRRADPRRGGGTRPVVGGGRVHGDDHSVGAVGPVRHPDLGLLACREDDGRGRGFLSQGLFHVCEQGRIRVALGSGEGGVQALGRPVEERGAVGVQKVDRRRVNVAYGEVGTKEEDAAGRVAGHGRIESERSTGPGSHVGKGNRRVGECRRRTESHLGERTVVPVREASGKHGSAVMRRPHG